jgi:hypothetical protein
MLGPRKIRPTLVFRFVFSSFRPFVILFLPKHLTYAKSTTIRLNSIVERAPKPRARSRLNSTDERNAMDKGIQAMSENTAHRATLTTPIAHMYASKNLGELAS